MTGRSTLAVIVPVLGDTAALRALLGHLGALEPPASEVIVVSGQADGDAAALCRAHGCTYIEAPPCRGVQLDRGAAAATADVLWFVHADAAVTPQSAGAILAAVTAGAAGGCLRFAFQGPPTWRKTLLERLIALRVRCGGIPYGDQGLFVHRDRYRDCGGFAPEPLFEEVRLVKRLRAAGRFEQLDVPIRVSPRRWERDGWWRRTLHNRCLALAHALGVPATRLARSYRGLLGSEGEADR